MTWQLLSFHLSYWKREKESAIKKKVILWDNDCHGKCLSHILACCAGVQHAAKYGKSIVCVSVHQELLMKCSLALHPPTPTWGSDNTCYVEKKGIKDADWPQPPRWVSETPRAPRCAQLRVSVNLYMKCSQKQCFIHVPASISTQSNSHSRQAFYRPIFFQKYCFWTSNWKGIKAEMSPYPT